MPNKQLIRLGQINFINCLPINYALKQHMAENPGLPFEFEVFAGTPAELNQKLRSGDLDLAPISCYEYLINKKQYGLLENFSVSSKVEADSVLFLSKKPLEELSTINITNKSATAVSLLKIILMKKYQLINFEYNSFAKDEDFDNKLLIGDEALAVDKSQYQVVLDLGSEWYDYSGLPMVFGVWAYRNEFRVQPEFIEFMQKVKADAFDKYFPDAIVEAYTKTGIAKSKLTEYFDHLEYDLAGRHLASMSLYEDLLKELVVQEQFRIVS